MSHGCFAELTLDTEESRQLIAEGSKNQVKTNAVIEFSYKVSSSIAVLESNMEQASHGAAALQLVPDSVQQAATVVGSLPAVVDTFKPMLDDLLKNVGTIVKVVDGMAQVGRKPQMLGSTCILSSLFLRFIRTPV